MEDPTLRARVEVLEERLRGSREALALQAKEYERRLEDLNHAHQRSQEDRLSFLPREVYDRSESRFREWMAGVDKELNTQRGKDSGKAATFAIFFSVVSMLIGIAALLMKLH